MENHYYNASDLKKFGKVSEAVPDLSNKFFEWYGDVFKEGALSKREKAIMALAVSFAVQCPYCIDAYTNDSLKLGFTEEQMVEAMHVAAAIKGGAAMVHGVQMKNILDKKIMK
jgi:alkylhydroperoxidase/carboxymuconolactone decarboxylase family protein